MIKPYYQDDAVTIFHGDCRDVLPELPPESIDLLLTDAPYGMAFVNFSRGNKATQSGAAQNVKGDGVRQGMRTVRAMLSAAGPALAPDAHLYLFCHWESWPDFYDSAATYIPIRGALIWKKNTHGPGNFAQDYQRDYEIILYGARGTRSLNGGFDSSILEFPAVYSRAKEHPTEKPRELFAYLIGKSTPEGGLVCDPFMGVGPSLHAAKESGRKAGGIEVEERYCEIAASRMVGYIPRIPPDSAQAMLPLGERDG